MCSLVYQAPANIVWSNLKNRFPERLESVELSGVSGTFWSGSADEIIIDGNSLSQFGWAVSSFSPAERLLSFDLKVGHSRSDIFFDGLMEIGGSVFRSLIPEQG